MKGLTKFALLAGAVYTAGSVLKTARNERDIDKEEFKKELSRAGEEIEQNEQANIVSGVRKKMGEEKEKRKKWLEFEEKIEKKREREREEFRQREKIPWLPLDEPVAAALLDEKGNPIGRPFLNCKYCNCFWFIPRGSRYKCDSDAYTLECYKCERKVGWPKEKMEEFFPHVHNPNSYKQTNCQKKTKKRKNSKKKINTKKLRRAVHIRLENSK